ncbi:MAG TPA: hypothetical protein HPP87_07880 [Planctomycetes bacterium]|nr:hypothetical protein [Planctomycetota bacterium]
MYTRAEHRGFEKIRVGGWTVLVSSDFGKASESLFPPFGQTDGVRGPFGEVPASDFARVFKCSVVFRGWCHRLYVKQFLFRSTWDFLKHIFRASRAKRAFFGSLMLAEQGFFAAETVALGERGFGPLCTSSFLITRELVGAEDLYCCFDGKNKDIVCKSPGAKRRFIRALGETIGRMHRSGIFHGDLRAGNVFAKSSNGTWRFFFLDNERTGRFGVLPSRLRLKNLVQLNMLQSEAVSLTDRMRFFKAYLAQNSDVRNRWKELARRTVIKTRRRLQHRSCGDML